MSILVGHCRACGFEAELFTLKGLDFVPGSLTSTEYELAFVDHRVVPPVEEQQADAPRVVHLSAIYRSQGCMGGADIHPALSRTLTATEFETLKLDRYRPCHRGYMDYHCPTCNTNDLLIARVTSQ